MTHSTTPNYPGGPGWVIRSSDLLPHITDQELFLSHHADDVCAPAIALLWTGNPTAALAAFAELAPSFRTRALSADALRDLGEFDQAHAEYAELLAENRGNRREAMIWQHWGKVYFVQGDVPQALSCFEKAHALRTEQGDEVLLASTQQAIERCREVLADQSF